MTNQITSQKGRFFFDRHFHLSSPAKLLFISILFSILFIAAKSHADTMLLHPNGKSSAFTSGTWTFVPTGSEATSLDSNDGDSTHAKSSTSGAKLYMDFDDAPANLTWTINSVQVFAIARCGNDCDNSIQVGFRAGPTDTIDRVPGSSKSVKGQQYRSFAGTLYRTNPRTNAAWTWADIDSLIGVVIHGANSNELRVTELLMNINYSKAVSPSGKSPLTNGWTFTPSGAGGEAANLDGNDGDSSYAQSSNTPTGETLYMDFDNPTPLTTTITGVQVHAIAKCVALPCNLEVGLRTNNADFFRSFGAVPGAGTISSGSGSTSVQGRATLFETQLDIGSQITAMGQTRTVTNVSDNKNLTVNTAFNPPLPEDDDRGTLFTFVGGTLAYQRFASDFFPKNPATQAEWSWSDISNLIGAVKHAPVPNSASANAVRVTQMYITINYIVPVVLSLTPEPGYGSADGVHPNSGNTSAPFTFKIIYTNLNNNPPASILVHIDNDGGHAMTRDSNAPADFQAENPELFDLNYENGEQYTYTHPSLPQGPHTYSFSATDGSDSAEKPVDGVYGGPGVQIDGGMVDILPSGQLIGTVGDWKFVGASGDTALDTNDGNTTYVEDNTPEEDSGDVLYLSMDDTGVAGNTIVSVQVTAVLCDTSGSTSKTTRFGLRLNGTDYLSTALDLSSCTTYTSYSPSSVFFEINPDTGKPWQWEEINSMIGVIRNERKYTIRATQFKVTVTHTPVVLSHPQETGYTVDGVHPDSGNSTTVFQYKVVYTNSNGTAPSAGNPKVHIDGNATGVAMSLDTGAPPEFQDGDYVNGEQYVYTAPAGYSNGIHNYYFSTTDGTNNTTLPSAAPTTTLSGPAISLPPGSINLFPSGVGDGSFGWVFCRSGEDCPEEKRPADPATALDTNDTDGSFARSGRNNDQLLMKLDSPLNNGQFITSVQIRAVVRDEGSQTGFTLGIYTVAQVSESPTILTTASYATYSGTSYGVNPMTGLPWTWTDLENLQAVITHKNNNSRIRVTQLYAVVTYGPIRLEASREVGYIVDGVDPDRGTRTTQFKFKTVYRHVNGVAPASGFPKVHIDGNATGVSMSLDTGATDATLRDGNYANGEQYIYTTTLSTPNVLHNHYFTGSDGTNTTRLPFNSSTTYSGPEVELNAGTFTLTPTNKSSLATTTGWTFVGSATTALDTNDGDTSYARSTVQGDRLYMDIDDPGTTPSDALKITSVQMSILVKHPLSSTSFDFGLRVGPEDFLTGTTKTTTASYTTYTGAAYTYNPANGEQWTWNDIKNLIGVVVHMNNNNEIRITQMSMIVNYSPIGLTYPSDPRYFDDGVDPNGGTTSTPFNYRIVYTQVYGVPPAAGYPKVHIDGNATGVAMTLDSQAPAALQDGDFTNGEQYIYFTTLSAQGAPHDYYFDVSDGANTLRTPVSGNLIGPVVSGKAPTLSFPSQTGYALQLAGTGTLTASGTSTVTGTGTSFTTQLRVGSTITAAGGQTRTVTAINSDNNLTTDTPFTPNLSGATFTYSAWSGTGNLTTSGTTTVTGSGTSFTTQLQVGSTITAAGQTRTVTAISSPTSLTVDLPFSPNLSSASFTFITDLPLRGVEPNTGTVNTPYIYKIIYTDADNNPPVSGYPRLLLDYNTVVHAMSLDTGATDATLRDGNYANGEQYTVTVYLSDPGTHAYSFDATDGVTPVFWPLNGDGFLAPSVTDSVNSGVTIYPTSRNFQTSGITFEGTDQDPATALDAGYVGNGTISNTSGSTTVTGINTNFTSVLKVGSLISAGSPTQTKRVTAIANDTSLTVDSAFSPPLSNTTWVFDGDFSYARSYNRDGRLYMNMDDVARSTSVITSVQMFTYVRDVGKSTSFSVGLQVGGSNYTNSYTTTANYTKYAGPLHATNPKTGAAWTWTDVNNLIGYIKMNCSCSNDDDHDNPKEMRATQIFIQVNYNSLPTLSLSPEAGYYGADGVDPDGWSPNHIFTYKIVYASGTNFAPTSLKVFIDGDAGHAMIHDGEFITNDPLRDGDYTNGEQFYYSTSPNQLPVGPHNYYFLASDGTNTFRLPASGTFTGPNVSVNEPFLTFSSEAGFGTDGLNPNSGASASQLFTYKVIYTHPDNNNPLYMKVHIDSEEHLMSLDGSAALTLRDNNYTNGEQYSYSTILPLGSHTYFFEATDGAKQVFLPVIPALGILSGPTVTDSSPPSAVTDLTISSRGSNSTTLTWTAPGNASTGSGCPCGTVVAYNIRYSTLKIVDDSATPGVGEIRFSDATAVTNSPTPQAAGATETVTIGGLTPNTPYYFAIKSIDEVPLTSPLSNVVNAANNPPIPSTNLATGWNMVSVPITPTPADVATVFGSSVGIPVNVKKWVSTGATNQTGSFSTLAATDTVQAGVGYFLNSPDSTRLLNPAGIVNTTATFSIPLQQGWTMIGNPYNKDINLEATCVSKNGGSGTCTSSVNLTNFKSYANAAAAGWVGNALYQWDGASSYTFKTFNDPDPTQKAVLRLWQGYWLQVTDVNPANTYSLFVVKP